MQLLFTAPGKMGPLGDLPWTFTGDQKVRNKSGKFCMHQYHRYKVHTYQKLSSQCHQNHCTHLKLRHKRAIFFRLLIWLNHLFLQQLFTQPLHFVHVLCQTLRLQRSRSFVRNTTKAQTKTNKILLGTSFINHQPIHIKSVNPQNIKCFIFEQGPRYTMN